MIENVSETFPDEFNSALKIPDDSNTGPAKTGDPVISDSTVKSIPDLGYIQDILEG